MSPAWLVLVSVTACGRFDIAEQTIGRDGAVADADPVAPDADPRPPDADPAGPDAPSPVGCMSGETPGPFSADFDGGLPPWAGFFEHSPGRIAVVAGTLTIQPDRSQMPPAYWGMGPTASGNDLRGHRVAVEVPEMVAVDGTTQVMLLWTWAAGEGLELYQSGGQLWCVSIINGARTEAQVAYQRAAHRWWQLHEDAGQVRCEASPDGRTWTTLRSVPTPPMLSNADVELAAGMYQPEVATPGNARFDNLIDCVTP